MSFVLVDQISSFSDKIIIHFTFLFPSIWILPRLLPSLHPGGEGNPALNYNDIDARMRLVFYPAVIGWTLLGSWIVSLKVRMNILKEKEHLSDIYLQEKNTPIHEA